MLEGSKADLAAEAACLPSHFEEFEETTSTLNEMISLVVSSDPQAATSLEHLTTKLAKIVNEYVLIF